MAISSSYDFTVTGDDIVDDAYFEIGIGQQGESMEGDLLIRGRRKLNLIVQQLVGDADGAASFKLWTREHATLFMQRDQFKYSLGPAATDDFACKTSEFTKTTLSVTANALDTTLTLTDASQAIDADYIMVMLDSGIQHQTTINGVPSGNVVTLTDVVPTQAGVTSVVYFFTNKIQKPDEILIMVRQEDNGDDTTLRTIDLYQYMEIPDKDATGDPTAYYEEEKLNQSDLYFDAAIDDASDIMNFVYLKPISDFDSAIDNPEFPKVWFLALVYELAIALCPGQGIEASQTLVGLRNTAMTIARNDKPETTVRFFEPNRVY